MKPGTVPPNPFGVRESVLMNPAVGSPNLVESAGPTDPQVCFISVRGVDHRPIALFGNYSLHYVGGVPEGDLSGDYFAAFADRVQQLLGADRQDTPFVGIMSNGASGDINNNDFRRGRAAQPPYGRIRIVADEIASAVAEVEKSLRYHDWMLLGVAQDELELGIRHPSPAELASAYHGDVPTPEDFRLGGYETWSDLSSRLEIDASTKVLARLG